VVRLIQANGCQDEEDLTVEQRQKKGYLFRAVSIVIAFLVITAVWGADTGGGLQEGKAGEKAVTIDFDGVDIVVFIKFISELTGKNFVIDSAVRGNVTVISPTRITPQEAYMVFESVLDVHGYAAVPAGNIIKIIPAAQTRGQNVETRLRESAVSPSDKVVTRIVPLAYANADEIKKILDPLVSKGSIIVSYPPAGMLVVTDLLSNIQRLLKIIEAVDVQGMGEQITVVPLTYGSAAPMAKSISGLFQDTSRKTKRDATPEPIIKVIADERTNSLIVLASEADTAKIRELIKLLDREPVRGEGDVRVYYLQNAKAEDMAKVLMAIPVAPAGKEQEKGKTPILSKEVQIVADKSTNSLVITAGKDDWQVLEEVIRKLDITRRMVYIEALLMEVSVAKDFELGVEWRGAEKTGSIDGRQIVTFGASTSQPSAFPGVNTGTQSVTLPLGFSLGVLGEGISIGGFLFPNIGAVVRAYQKDSDVHILSTPQIMTTDNEDAEIQVGKNVPYLTRQDTSQSGIDYSHYEYKDVGVTLQITPQINQDRFVRLKIMQEVSQVIKEESSVGLPTTLKRMAKTTVIVKDGHTIVIGGLIDDTMNSGVYRVPCLGGIPGLGNFFRTESSNTGKTNLFVFLTPHIIEYVSEADGLYREKKEQIDKVKEGSIKMYERKGGK